MYFPINKEKIVLVRPGIKPITFVSVDGAKQTMAKMIGMNLMDFYKKSVVGTIAELHPNKDLKTLIEAMEVVVSQQPNAICIIIGEGQQKEELARIIEEKRLTDKIFLAGFLDNASEYIKAFQVFVLPSIKEGLPYVILEAGFASLPVVATTVGGIPEIIDDMRSGILIQPKNPRELAHAISFMIEHPEERKRYGNNLREQINIKYSIQNSIENNERIYLET